MCSSSLLIDTALKPFVGSTSSSTLPVAQHCSTLVLPAPSKPRTRTCVFLVCSTNITHQIRARLWSVLFNFVNFEKTNIHLKMLMLWEQKTTAPQQQKLQFLWLSPPSFSSSPRSPFPFPSPLVSDCYRTGKNTQNVSRFDNCFLNIINTRVLICKSITLFTTIQYLPPLLFINYRIFSSY